MITGNDIRVQEFLGNLAQALSQLESLNIDQLEKRITGLKGIIAEFSNYTIRSGLVGITSSGKSSLLNILLGTEKKILKEQAKATTNMITFCAKSAEPRLEIHFEDGRTIEKFGNDVLAEPLSKYTSEDENPQNRYNVKFIRLSLPTFLLDNDIEIADTPGLDAYGLKEHEDLTLREFLPQADLIIYVSSMGSPMKGTDRRTLNQIMDADQQVVFVQTCKGAVVEQSNGDGTTVSVTAQLARHKGAFQQSIEHYPKLKDAPIVQIETTVARDYLKNKDLAAWQESGFEELAHAIDNAAARLRSSHVSKNLRITIDSVKALSDLLKSTAKKGERKEGGLEEKTKYLNKIKDDLDKILNDKNEIASNWTVKLDHSVLFDRYSAELSRIFAYRYDFNPMHDKEFIAKAHAIGERIKKIKDDFLDSLDSAKERYREYFKGVDLEVRRKDIQNIVQRDFSLPNVQKKRVAEALGIVGSPTKLSSWQGQKAITDEYIDKQKYIADIGVSLQLYFEPLLNHLDWWEKSVYYSYIEPLQKKIAALEDDIRNIDTGFCYDDARCDSLADISSDLDILTGAIAEYCGADQMVFKGSAYAGFASQTGIPRRRSDNRNLFMQLGSRLFENMFHFCYLKELDAISSKPKKNIVFIGHDYGAQISFLRHLFRLNNEDLARLLESKPPVSINLQEKSADIRNIDIDDELGNEVSFYVLGNDFKSLEIAEANKLCEKADVIQLMVDDLHRVASALTDIVERNLFFNLISKHKDKLLLVYPAAAHFQRERLHIMFSEALSEVNKVFSYSRTKWFIHENFEVRYNYFNEFALKITERNLDIESCIKEWQLQEIPLDEPFTEKVLREQFELLLNG
ncbi:MAG: dynamin family protein [Nitrospirae bacterium]|nr:dynamin family protein [Nitrospirota bacterium]